MLQSDMMEDFCLHSYSVTILHISLLKLKIKKLKFISEMEFNGNLAVDFQII